MSPLGALLAAQVEAAGVLPAGPRIGIAVAVGAVVGGVTGGLVPLPAYRLSVPFGDPPRAACQQCEAALPEGDSGWIAWGGRCRSCGARLGPPALLTAAIGALVGAGLGWRFGLTITLVPFLLLAAVGLLLAVVDLRCQRLPTALLWPLIVGGAALLAITSEVIDEQAALTRGVLAALVLGGAYVVLAALPGANLGFGDVRLAVALGLYLGWLGWVEAIAGVLVLPFLLNAPVALAMLLTRRANRKSMMPFGPAMLAGAFVGAVGWHALVAAAAR